MNKKQLKVRFNTKQSTGFFLKTDSTTNIFQFINSFNSKFAIIGFTEDINSIQAKLVVDTLSISPKTFGGLVYKNYGNPLDVTIVDDPIKSLRTLMASVGVFDKHDSGLLKELNTSKTSWIYDKVKKRTHNWLIIVRVK